MDQFLFDVDILFILLENTLYLLGLYCLVCISVQCCDLLGQSQTPHHLLIGMRQVGTLYCCASPCGILYRLYFCWFWSSPLILLDPA